MKKKYFSIGVLALMLFTASTALWASPKIAKIPSHKGKNCAFCHQKAGFPKEKAGYDKNGKNYKKIASNSLCSGPECHK
ncbi:MAG: hypothetical protein LBT84_04515 [Spirochaetia bacterium]|jgi:hypothetical protein|nr:hypothetical protein [Spirochaetia bacterium]